MAISGALLAFFAGFAVLHASAIEDDVQCDGQSAPALQDGGQDGAEDVEDVGLLHLRTSQATTLKTNQTCATPGVVCSPCISKATVYGDLWRLYGTPGDHPQPGCVSAELWGSVHDCGSETLYPEDAEKAWIFGKVDLEQLLYLQWKYAKTPTKVSAAALVIIGYGPPYLEADITGQCLAVFQLPKAGDAGRKGLIPEVPVFSYWFSHMSRSGFMFDYNSVQKRMIVAYSHVSWQNVLDVFSRLTSCSVASLKKGDLTPYSRCSKSSLNVYNDLADYAQKGINGCVQAFWANKGNKWNLKNAGDVRMMLWRCYDVNPFNTGIGLGWNSYPNPLVCTWPGWQSNYDHYTGEEYVIDNRNKDNFIGYDDIVFANTTAAGNTKLIKRGFC